MITVNKFKETEHQNFDSIAQQITEFFLECWVEGFVDSSGQHNTLNDSINEFVSEAKLETSIIVSRYGFDRIESIKVITYKPDVSEFSNLYGTSFQVRRKQDEIFRSFHNYQQYPAWFDGWDARACVSAIIGEIPNEQTQSYELHVVFLCYPNHTLEA